MIRDTVRADPRIRLIGAVRGLRSEAPRVVTELSEFRPDAVGVGLSVEELRGLQQYFLGAIAEPIVPLTSNEIAEVRGLAHFGEISVPNPACLAALEWARTEEVQIEPLDPTDDRLADLFTDNIGYLELVRRTVTERRLARRPPTASSPDEYAILWDQELSAGRGSRKLSQARDRLLVANARALVRSHQRVAVLVDRERYAPVLSMLNGAPSSPPS